MNKNYKIQQNKTQEENMKEKRKQTESFETVYTLTF